MSVSKSGTQPAGGQAQSGPLITESLDKQESLSFDACVRSVFKIFSYVILKRWPAMYKDIRFNVEKQGMNCICLLLR